MTATIGNALAERVTALEWHRIGAELDRHGCAVGRGLLSHEECVGLAALYGADGPFRATG